MPALQRVDIEGAGAVGPLDRELITGPGGVLLCGGLGGVVVGLGRLAVAVAVGFADAVVVAADAVGFAFVLAVVGVDSRESLIAPPLGRSPEALACGPGSIGASPVRAAGAGAALVRRAAGGPEPAPQAAQTRAAATAVAAALAGATVPRIGMMSL